MTRVAHLAVCFFGLTVGCLLVLGFAGGQDGPFGGKGKEKGPKWDKGGKEFDPEAKAIYKSAERAVRGGGETEREKWLDEMKKVFQGQLSPGLTRDDFAQWYGLLAGDGPVWRRDAAPRKGIVELFDRTAARLGLGEAETIRRDEFLAYARRFLDPGGSPPWKDPLSGGADKVFRELDRDGSGFLEPNEWTDSLRAVARQVDANRDGKIDRDEYRRYFENRVALAIESGPPVEKPGRNDLVPQLQKPNDRKGPAEDEKPVAMRYGKLPGGLPAWFEEYDFDKDGQIALYEWRKAGRSIAEFQEMDLNGDGLLTADEYLRYERERKRTLGADEPDEKPVTKKK
jgi:EF hand